jgi:hypothetical protein
VRWSLTGEPSGNARRNISERIIDSSTHPEAAPMGGRGGVSLGVTARFPVPPITGASSSVLEGGAVVILEDVEDGYGRNRPFNVMPSRGSRPPTDLDPFPRMAVGDEVPGGDMRPDGARPPTPRLRSAGFASAP